jgi:hypothetical protein
MIENPTEQKAISCGAVFDQQEPRSFLGKPVYALDRESMVASRQRKQRA